MNARSPVQFIVNARLIDGTGAPPREEIVIRLEGERITTVGHRRSFGELPEDAAVIDAGGRTVMPGLIESHFHLSFTDGAFASPLADPRVPPDYIAIQAARTAERALQAGYTAVRSCGSTFFVDQAVKLGIERGLIKGPRLKPSGPEITATGGIIASMPSWTPMRTEGLVIAVDGPIEARRAARRLIRDGAEVVKCYPSGDPGSDRLDPLTNSMFEDEVRALCEETHLHRGCMVAAHATNPVAVKMCVRAGVDSIEHAFFTDEEAIGMMAEAQTFLVPALGYLDASLRASLEGRSFYPPSAQDRLKRTIEAGAETARKALAAGVPVALGGDYGFAWNPHTSYARELEFFVNYVGWSPMQAIVAATKTGGRVMLQPGELGTVEPGKFADLLIVDGDPLADIALLQRRECLMLIMKGGEVVGGTLYGGGKG